MLMPTLEMGVFDIHHDSATVQTALSEAPPSAHVSLTSPYFNVTDDYSYWLLHFKALDIELLVAHPTVNGLYKSSGLSGYIPALYRRSEEGSVGTECVSKCRSRGRPSL